MNAQNLALLNLMKHMAGVIAPYCAPFDAPLSDWLDNYAQTRSESVPLDSLSTHHLSNAFALALSKIVSGAPDTVGALLPPMMATVRVSDARFFIAVASTFFVQGKLFDAAGHIRDNLDARYVFMALLLVLTQDHHPAGSPLAIFQLQQDELQEDGGVQARAERAAAHAQRVRSINTSLRYFQCPPVPDLCPVPLLQIKIAAASFGEPWAELYARAELSTEAIIRDVLIQQPPFVNARVLQSSPVSIPFDIS